MNFSKFSLRDSRQQLRRLIRTILPAIGALIVAILVGVITVKFVGFLQESDGSCEGASALVCAGFAIVNMLVAMAITIFVTAYLLLRVRKIPHAAAITVCAIVTTVLFAYVMVMAHINILPVWVTYILWLIVYIVGFAFYDWLFNVSRIRWPAKLLLVILPVGIAWLIGSVFNL